MPTLCEVEMTSGSDNSSLDGGSHEFGGPKQALPKFNGSSADFRCGSGISRDLLLCLDVSNRSVR